MTENECCVCGKIYDKQEGWITFLGSNADKISTIVIRGEEDNKSRVLKSVIGPLEFCSMECLLNAGNDVLDKRDG